MADLSKLHPNDDFYKQLQVSQEDNVFTFHQSVKIAVLSASTFNHYLPIFSYWLSIAHLDTTFYLAPFDSIEIEILNPDSGLYVFNPDIILLMPTSYDTLKHIPPDSNDQLVAQYSKKEAQRWGSLWDCLKARSNATVIHSLPVSIPNPPLGNLDRISPQGMNYRLSLFTQQLIESKPQSVIFWDLNSVANFCGYSHWYDWRLWYHSKHYFSLDVCGRVAYHFSRVVAGIRGMSKKVCILDLDNTLWGGVIGDDGLENIVIGNDSGAVGEAFLAFQYYLKTLSETGVVLAVSSKNELKNAQTPFLNHPNMLLTLDDFADFRANWNSKVENILAISKYLNLPLNSMVFIDDNPVERTLIRDSLPEVYVVELPDDPSNYITCLSQLHLFEKPIITQEDQNRTKMMAAMSFRNNSLESRKSDVVINLEHHLSGLELQTERSLINKDTLARATQLINKTNQFNVSSSRLTESEVIKKCASGLGMTYTLSDKFGKYGIVSVILISFHEKKLKIDVWVLSCRAFHKTLEAYIMLDLITLMKQKKCICIELTYQQTEKNLYCHTIIQDLGFVLVNNKQNLYRYQITKPMKPLQTFITLVEQLIPSGELNADAN